MQNWLDGPSTAHSGAANLGVYQPGMLAEYVVLPASGVVRTPAYLSSTEAAALPIAGLTAWAGLVEYGHLRPGQTVLTQGTGGVSIAALQLAKATDARVIATTGSDDKAAQLKALGADEVINYRTTPDWPAQVKALTGGEGVDLTINTVGGEFISQSLQAIRHGGFVGVIEGIEATFNVPQAFSQFATLKGYSVGSRRMFEDYARALVISGLRPVVDRTFPLAEALAAFRYLESGAHDEQSGYRPLSWVCSLFYPTTFSMQAYILDNPGTPSGPSALRLAQLPTPAIGPDEVLVRTKALSINPVDYQTKLRQGRLRPRKERIAAGAGLGHLGRGNRGWEERHPVPSRRRGVWHGQLSRPRPCLCQVRGRAGRPVHLQARH